jgi:Tfp pilus assembly PilM family ATPase
MSRLFSLSDADSPDVAVEIAAGRVSAAQLERRGGKAVVAAHTLEPLPVGALVPSFTAANALDKSSVITALNRVLERVGRPRRVALVVPDAVGKVSLVKLEKVPARTADLDQVIRWQVRKTAPFPIDEAQVSYVPGLRAADGQEFVVSLARRSVVEEYETLCSEAGAYAGIVDLATFNVINAILAGSSPTSLDGDWLAINVCLDSASIAIMRGPHVIFFRNRTADADGTLADLVHQTGMYYEDRLQGAGFTKAFLCAPGQDEEVRRMLQERLPVTIEAVDPRQSAALTDRIVAGPALLDTLTPLVGVLVRDRQAVQA